MTGVVFHPTDSTRAIATGYSGNAYVSTNGGATWTAATGLPGGSFVRVERPTRRSTPTTVYASVDINGGSVYKSTNGGASYTAVFNGAPDYLARPGLVRQHASGSIPTNANTVIVGGIDLWKSTNGGASFTQDQRLVAGARLRARGSSRDCRAARIQRHDEQDGVVRQRRRHLRDDRRLYRRRGVAARPAGASSTTTWASRSSTAPRGGTTTRRDPRRHAGQRHAEVHAGGRHEVDDGVRRRRRRLGGRPVEQQQPVRRVHLRRRPSQHRWRRQRRLDQRPRLERRAGPVCKPAPYCDRRHVQSASRGELHRARSSSIRTTPTACSSAALSLWRTNDATTPNTATTGPSWASVKPASGAGNYISAIAVAPGNSNTIWVGHNNGQLFKTTNGTAAAPTWTASGAGTLPNRFVTRVRVDPTDANTVYVTYGGFSAATCGRRPTAGPPGSSASGSGATGLPAVPVRDIAIYAPQPTWLYAATEVGLFTSQDGGSTWTVPSDGPANVSIEELFWMGVEPRRGDARARAVQGHAEHGSSLTPVITWPAPAPITVGTALERDAVERDGDRAGHVRLHAGGRNAAVGRGGPHAVGDVHADRHRQLHQATASVAIDVVAKRRRRSRWSTPADIVYGTALSAHATQCDHDGAGHVHLHGRPPARSSRSAPASADGDVHADRHGHLHLGDGDRPDRRDVARA